MLSLALLIIVISIVFIVVLLCSEGWSWLAYRIYSAHSVASVCEEVPFTLNESKGTVEKMEEDGTFQRLPCTEDRNVGHQPFYYFLFEKKRVQYVFEWKAEGTLWRGHYRYLKKRNSFAVGQTVELHYQKGKPWRYAIEDQTLWTWFWVKLAAYAVLLAVGICLFAHAIA